MNGEIVVRANISKRATATVSNIRRVEGIKPKIITVDEITYWSQITDLLDVDVPIYLKITKDDASSPIQTNDGSALIPCTYKGTDRMTFSYVYPYGTKAIAYSVTKGSALPPYGYGVTWMIGVPNQLAFLSSPSFTGTPTAPTPAAGTNNTTIATTAFVKDAIDTAIDSIENGNNISY